MLFGFAMAGSCRKFNVTLMCMCTNNSICLWYILGLIDHHACAVIGNNPKHENKFIPSLYYHFVLQAGVPQVVSHSASGTIYEDEGYVQTYEIATNNINNGDVLYVTVWGVNGVCFILQDLRFNILWQNYMGIHIFLYRVGDCGFYKICLSVCMISF